MSNILLLILLSALGLAAGCSSEEACSVGQGHSLATDSGSEQTRQGFSVDVTLCRKVSRKSGRAIGAGDEFKITKKSYVNSLVDFQGVQLDRNYVVHLVWVRPDGKEIFRKYVQVAQNAVGEAGRQTLITWLDAEDLHKIKQDTVMTETPGFQLKTRLNISQKKNRDLGEYSLLVYLDRRLLLEKPFLVTGDPPSEEPVQPAAADQTS